MYLQSTESVVPEQLLLEDFLSSGFRLNKTELSGKVKQLFQFSMQWFLRVSSFF